MVIIFYRIQSDSPNVRKVSIMLQETGLPHRVHTVAKRDGERVDDDLLRVSPNGTVPAIVDQETGATLFESGAILYYLATKSNRLIPADLAARGEVMKWVMFEAANMGPAMSELYHYLLSDAADEAIMGRYRRKLAQFCAILDRQLAGRDYLCGDCSIADIAIFPWSAIIEFMAEISLDDYPNLRAWVDVMNRRSAIGGEMRQGG